MIKKGVGVKIFKEKLKTKREQSQKWQVQNKYARVPFPSNPIWIEASVYPSKLSKFGKN